MSLCELVVKSTIKFYLYSWRLLGCRNKITRIETKEGIKNMFVK